MYAVRCRERSTTAGTGNLTLGGAEPGCRSITSVFSNGTTAIDYEYNVISRDGSQWEEGYGYLSNSTTMVRRVIRANSSGGTSAVAFAAGIKDVAAWPISNGTTPTLPTVYSSASSRILPSMFNQPLILSTVTLASNNRVYFVPYFYGCSANVDAVALMCRGSAAGNLTAGIYSVDTSTGLPGNVIQSGASVAVASGIVASNFTSRALPVGWYFLGYYSDNTSTWDSMDLNATYVRGVLGADGSGGTILGFRQTTVYSGGTMPVVGTLTALSYPTAIPVPYLRIG